MRLPLRAAVAATLLATLASTAAAESQSSATGPVSGSSSGSAGTASGGATPLGPYSGPESRTWTACGGFSLFSPVCAAIRITVDGTTTTIGVQNLSGASGLTRDGVAVMSAGQWVITKVGFDNVPSTLSTTGVGATTGAWIASSASPPRAWSRFDDRQFGGGERIDLGATNGGGITGGLASSCAPVGSLPGGSSRLWMTPNPACDAYVLDGAVDEDWLEVDLFTTTGWDPNASGVTTYFKAQNGPGGASYECILGGATGRGGCFDVRYTGIGSDTSAQSVPEPGTLVLMATGAAGLVVLARRRRAVAAAQ